MILDREVLQAKIMIIDDDQSDVSLLETILKSAKYTHIKGITDSRKSSVTYRDFRPDLVLLDLKMPHMDGFQVMKQLKDIERESYVPVLVLTADHEYKTRLHALEMGAKDFLTKPLNMMEVLNRIRNMLEVRLLHNQVSGQKEILEQKVRERTKELNETRLEIIRRLSIAAEYRDNETGLHIIRMSKMSALLGKAIGMNETQQELLLNASPMHDIGKIAIPDRILLKPGKFDQEEWEIMKTHTTIGAKILSGNNSELMELARVIALTHHEKWDGSGYPKGLKGEEIPLEGRICGLCDVFDALSSKRTYKKAWSIEDTVAEIDRTSGTHFDPILVKLFKKILPDVLAIKKQYVEPEGNNAGSWLYRQYIDTNKSSQYFR